MAKVAFLGLGVMGYPMAGHLSKEFNNISITGHLQKLMRGINSMAGLLPQHRQMLRAALNLFSHALGMMLISYL